MLFWKKKTDDTEVLDVIEANDGENLAKKYLTPKNVIILVLLVAIIVVSVIASVASNNAAEMRRNFDTLFAKNYNELIIDSRNGELSYSQNSFTPYDVENAKKGNLLVNLFSYTDYADNDSLRQIILILNDYIGEHRLYPTKPYSELPDQVYNGLFELSRDFGNEKLAKKVLNDLKDALS